MCNILPVLGEISHLEFNNEFMERKFDKVVTIDGNSIYDVIVAQIGKYLIDLFLSSDVLGIEVAKVEKLDGKEHECKRERC